MTSLIIFARLTAVVTIMAVLTAMVTLSVAAPSLDGRIVGGLLAPEHSFPFLVGLSIKKISDDNGTFWCGGSLIAPNFILTAAHCVYGGTFDVQVKLGTHNRKNLSLHGDLIDVHRSGVIIHQEYNPNNIENDIALIKLPSNVTLTDDIQVIQLALRYMDQDFLQDQVVTAAGWGKSVDNVTDISEALRYVDVKIIDLEKCMTFFNQGLVSSKNICIDGSEIKGTCNGDSGGPLVYQAVDDSRYLVGLTSFGSDHGCTKGFPAVFTRITSFLDWIFEHTGVLSN